MNGSSTFTWVIGGLVVGLIVALSIGYVTSKQQVEFTVSDKERVVTSDDSYYLVFTDEEVFANKDSLLFTKFRSSDLQAEMERGATCEATVAGWRIPFFSAYRNIIAVECEGPG